MPAVKPITIAFLTLLRRKPSPADGALLRSLGKHLERAA